MPTEGKVTKVPVFKYRTTATSLRSQLRALEQLQVVQEKRIVDLEAEVSSLRVGSRLQNKINEGLGKLLGDLQKYALDLGASHGKLMESHGHLMDMVREQTVPKPAKQQDNSVSEVA